MRLTSLPLLLSAAITASSTGLPCPSEPSPSYPADGPTATIKFLSKLSSKNEARVPLTIQTQYNNYTQHATVAAVDTGSAGLMVSLTTLGLCNKTFDTSRPGHISYSSNGNLYYNGYWLDAYVSFNDGAVNTTISVLAVTDENGDGIQCPPIPTYMGVGFGTPISSCPDLISFANVQQIDDEDVSDSIRQGYIVSEDSVVVGLTQSNTEGFNVSKLDPVLNISCPTGTPWQRVNMSISINGSVWDSGQALLDTGVNQSYILVHDDIWNQIKPINCTGCNDTTCFLQSGTDVAVNFGNIGNIIAPYNVTLGQGNPMEAAGYQITLNNTEVFINTGRNVFSEFDAMFDSDCGYYGLRSNGEPDRKKPSFGPSLEL